MFISYHLSSLDVILVFLGSFSWRCREKSASRSRLVVGLRRASSVLANQGCAQENWLPQPTPAPKIFKTAQHHPAPKMPWVCPEFTPPQPKIFFFCPTLPKAEKKLPHASLVIITELCDKEEQLVFSFLQTIYGGTNEIMKELIARSIVKEAAWIFLSWNV